MDWSQFKAQLAQRERRHLDRERHAAVLMPLVFDGGEPRVILTRRTEDLSTHKGQVAYPGGRMEPEDQGDVIQTALRESHEEVGLAPDSVQVLGLLDDFPTVSDKVAVTPIVGLLTQTPELTPDPREVARIFEIPLELLCQQDSWEQKQVERNGRKWPMYYCHYDGEVLWGLSAYITLHCLELLDRAPFSIPNHTIK